jgi:hypothetical protein
LTSRRLRWARLATALVSLGAFAWVLVDAFSEGFELPPNMVLRFAVAVPFSTAGLFAAATSWSVLAGESWRQGLSAFGTSLPLRHLPMGGVGQIAGMAGLSIASGADKRRAAQAGPLFLVVTAAGSSFVALPVVWDGAAPVLVGLAIAGSILLVLRGRLILGWLTRWWRVVEGSDQLPIGQATLWSSLAALGTAAAFSVLFLGADDPLMGVGRFSAAWLAGFLFVIAPAGLGAREAVLAALWPDADPAAVVAASLFHRVSTLAGEGLIFVVGLVLSRRVDRPDEERKT